MTRREMFSESDHAHGTEKLYKAHMSSIFQRTFQHLAAANNTLNGLPPLILAPSVQVPQLTAPPAPTPSSQSASAPAHSSQSPSAPAPSALGPSALGPSAPAPSAAAPTPSSQFEFINSTRGKPKLVHGGYIYVYQKNRSNGNIAWRCEQYSKPGSSSCM